VKDLTKPLGGAALKKKKQQTKTQGNKKLGSFLQRVSGGEPIVNVRIVEPKFDSADRDVGVVSVREKETAENIQDGLDDEPTVLTELTPDSDGVLTPLDPDEVLIYDPSKTAAPQKKVSLSTVGDRALLERSRYGFLPKVIAVQ